MSQIPFAKFTQNGNSFALLDETRGSLLTEKQKADFAWFATDINFGLGADNLLVIQPAEAAVMQEINSYRKYWQNIPDLNGCRFIFRMLEPDGKEALCCANGLLSVAKYLADTYSIKSAPILSGIPGKHPVPLKIGTEQKDSMHWVKFPFNNKDACSPWPENANCLFSGSSHPLELPIHFKEKSDPAVLLQMSPFTLKGHFVCFGEPHVVFFSRENDSSRHLEEFIFPPDPPLYATDTRIPSFVNWGENILHFLGMYLNTCFRKQFPEGVNVNFVHSRTLAREGCIEYRTFERGIYRETLACGTGALAIARAVSSQKILDFKTIYAKPYLTKHDPRIEDTYIKKEKDTFYYYGRPGFLLQGTCAAPQG